MIRRNYVIVGEAPARDVGKKNLHWSLACKAVRKRPSLKAFQWIRDEHPRLFEFMRQTVHLNLLDRWPGAGPKGKGAAFPMDEARDRADDMARELATPSVLSVEERPYCLWNGVKFCVPDLVILSGKRVASAFRFPAATEYWVVQPNSWQLAGRPAVIVPHPSGMNRWWNDEANRAFAVGFLNDLGWVRT